MLDSKVDGYITHANRAYYIANSNAEYYSMKIASISEQSSYNFLVAKTSPELFRIFNHANNLYSQEKISHLLSKYTIDDNEVIFKEFVKNNAAPFLAVTSVICMIIVFAVVLKNMRIKKLYDLSYIDSFTGVNNRNAYEKKLELLKAETNQSIGIIFAESSIYRISGDEFVIILSGCSMETVNTSFNSLIELSAQSYNDIFAAGMAWSGNVYDIQKMISNAEAEMYEMKKVHYSKYPNDRRQNRSN